MAAANYRVLREFTDDAVNRRYYPGGLYQSDDALPRTLARLLDRVITLWTAGSTGANDFIVNRPFVDAASQNAIVPYEPTGLYRFVSTPLRAALIADRVIQTWAPTIP